MRDGEMTKEEYDEKVNKILKDKENRKKKASKIIKHIDREE